jgi:hypothetical protein
MYSAKLKQHALFKKVNATWIEKMLK